MRHKKDTNTNYSAIANKQRKISIRNVKCKIKYGLGLTAAATITSIIGLSQSFSDISSALSISSLSSTSGSVDGGNEITIKGKGFLKSYQKQDKIVQVAGGTKYGYGTTFTLTESGKVYSYGDNSRGQAGTGASCNTDTDNLDEAPCFYKEPQDITSQFNGERVNKIYEYSAITDNNVYIWGRDYIKPTIVRDLSNKRIIGIGDTPFSSTSLFLDNGIQFDEYNISQYLDGASIKDYVDGYVLTSRGSILRFTYNANGDLSFTGNITDRFEGSVKQLTAYDHGLLVLSNNGNLSYIAAPYNTPARNITSNVASLTGYDNYGTYFTKDDGNLYYYNDYSNTVDKYVDSVAVHTYSRHHDLKLSYVSSSNPDEICTIDGGEPRSIKGHSCTTIPLQAYTITEPSIKSLSFGDVTTDKFAIVDDNTLKVTVPRHVAGKVNIKMTDSNNKTSILKDGYEYVDETAKRDPNTETTPRQDAAGVKNSANHDNKTITAPNTGV